MVKNQKLVLFAVKIICLITFATAKNYAHEKFNPPEVHPPKLLPSYFLLLTQAQAPLHFSYQSIIRNPAQASQIRYLLPAAASESLPLPFLPAFARLKKPLLQCLPAA